jgi:FlaA1/EpsC-like NDP-sugar epimerase
MNFTGKRVLITGGTGSLGRVLVRRLLRGDAGVPSRIVIFSRDEAKQYAMHMAYARRKVASEDLVYEKANERLEFRVGDVRDFHSIASALQDIDIVFNAAALKQVPTCEYFPYEAVQTNILGPQNIVGAIRENRIPVRTVVCASTDKACKPVNVMGMTKAIQERVFVQANLTCPDTRFVCVRYGNVLASRGSVIPLFHNQIANGGPITLTSPDMTRFLLSLDDAVTLIFTAVAEAEPGETFVPDVPSARVKDVAALLVGDRPIEITVTGVRPGEKVHEVLVSEDECHRTVRSGSRFIIQPTVPELRSDRPGQLPLAREFSSADRLLSLDELKELLARHGLLDAARPSPDEEYL